MDRTRDMGVAASPPGHSAEPEPVPVSALRASVPNADFSVADMLGYGHAAYCAGWRAALRLSTGRPISDSHGYDWLSEHPPTAGGEPLWRGLPPLAQGIEARSAETGTGSVRQDESPVGNADAPNPSDLTPRTTGT